MTAAGFSHAGLAFSAVEGEGAKPVLFQHGLCATAAQPGEVFPASPRWRCLTLECRGHGRSEPGPADAFGISTFTDDIAAFLDKCGTPPLAVGGISMGAAIALRLAIRRPELVRALILARPAWLTEPIPENLAPNIAVGELLRRYPPAEARTRFEATDLARRLAVEAPDNLASLRSFFARTPQAATAELLCRISADGPGVTVDEVAGLAVPTLIIGTAQDVMHPLFMAHALAASIPGAHMVEISAKSIDRTAYVHDFQSALAAFLEEIDR